MTCWQKQHPIFEVQENWHTEVSIFASETELPLLTRLDFVKMQHCADWVKLASFSVSWMISGLLLAKILNGLEFVKIQHCGRPPICNYFHQNIFCQNAALCRLSRASFILRLLNDQCLLLAKILTGLEFVKMQHWLGNPLYVTIFTRIYFVKMQQCADWVKLASFSVSSVISCLLLAKLLTGLEFVKIQHCGRLSVRNYFHQNIFCQNAALCRLSKASFILRLLNDQWLEGKNKLSTRNLTLNIKTMVMKSTQAKIQKYCLNESKLLFHRTNLSICLSSKQCIK